MDIILASGSLRRIQIMNELNIAYKVITSNVSEDIDHTIKPEEIVMELSKRKATSVFNNNKDSFVMGFDTIVSINGEILEKPKDREDCKRMIELISDKCHEVFTGVYLVKEGYEKSFYTKTVVKIDDLKEDFINEYINTEEPYDKAGGYAIQETFKEYAHIVEGDIYTVIGLPKKEIEEILRDLYKTN